MNIKGKQANLGDRQDLQTQKQQYIQKYPFIHQPVYKMSNNFNRRKSFEKLENQFQPQQQQFSKQEMQQKYQVPNCQSQQSNYECTSEQKLQMSEKQEKKQNNLLQQPKQKLQNQYHIIQQKNSLNKDLKKLQQQQLYNQQQLLKSNTEETEQIIIQASQQQMQNRYSNFQQHLFPENEGLPNNAKSIQQSPIINQDQTPYPDPSQFNSLQQQQMLTNQQNQQLQQENNYKIKNIGIGNQSNLLQLGGISLGKSVNLPQIKKKKKSVQNGMTQDDIQAQLAQIQKQQNVAIIYQHKKNPNLFSSSNGKKQSQQVQLQQNIQNLQNLSNFNGLIQQNAFQMKQQKYPLQQIRKIQKENEKSPKSSQQQHKQNIQISHQRSSQNIEASRLSNIKNIYMKDSAKKSIKNGLNSAGRQSLETNILIVESNKDQTQALKHSLTQQFSEQNNEYLSNELGLQTQQQKHLFMIFQNNFEGVPHPLVHQAIKIMEGGDQKKLEMFYRYHPVTLIQLLSKKDAYLDSIQQSQPIKTFQFQIPKKQDTLTEKYISNCYSKIEKFASTKGKYKYRERFNFSNVTWLKAAVNYDMKKKLEEKREAKMQRKMLKEKLKQIQNYSSESESQDDDSPISKNNKHSQPQISDLAQWKKKNGLTKGTKVYIIKGGYRSLKEVLNDRGWVENPDHFSPCFDFKWTCKIQDVNFDSLKDFQVVNHFDQNQCITSKFGLPRSLQSIVYNDDIDVDEFYPRCYDLGDLAGFEDFIQNYQFSKIEQILKLYQENIDSLDWKNHSSLYQFKIKLACNILQRRLKPFNELQAQIMYDIFPVVTPDEWEFFKKEVSQKDSQLNIVVKEVKNQLEISRSQSTQQNSEGSQPQSTNTQTEAQDRAETQPNSSKALTDRESVQDQQQQQQKDGENEQETEEIKQECLKLINNTLKKLEQQDPQFHMNGKKNIWIVKPNYLSRGRGIKLFQSLDKILDQIISQEKIQYVVQKYIENPLIILKKKFDIRQWVVVQDWNPPKIWFYEECYVRFCSKDYNEDDIMNKNAHLTNNCINKAGKNQEIKENMWTQSQLAKHLEELTGKDIFFEQIQPLFKKIVINSVKCCNDQIVGRKNSMELFGYDFMIDDQFKPWLIEVNSSPTMEHSTSITQNLVTNVLDDIVKVTMDYNFAKKAQKKNTDTGGFQLIYKGGSGNGDANKKKGK